ncbi:MAG: hypothetical protein HDS48_03720 [Bacteroides sp.]|nr:hypothetical protein [Bacteroides sp.]
MNGTKDTNTLIIGLGGTGGKIIRDFRKRYFEEFKTFEPQNGCYIDYLYVDSDERDLATPWRTQGVSTGLSNSQKVSTHGMNTNDLDQLEDRPQLRGFINTNEVDLIKERLGKIISEGIGGQRRRLGRMLMASHVKQDEGFVAKLKGRVAMLQSRSNQHDVHFHICAGLAGGTGSGSIVDTIAQIRQIYGDGPQVHLYLYVPERQTVYSDNVEYYQANGYAALIEINAIACGKYNPVDITGTTDPYTGEIRRIESAAPITGTYLFSNVNERGRILSLKDELPQMVADFLFQKIYVDKDATLNVSLAKTEKFENGDPTEEMDAKGERVRNIKNLSFGFRRVIFPETEIKEHIAYKLAERAVLQMHFQNWTSAGYTIATREGATDDITAKTIADDREKLFLGNRVLTRETGLSKDDSVQDFFETFNTPAASYSEDALSMDKDEWLNYFNGMMSAFFKKKFRRMGVVPYFAQETTDAPKYARKIVRKIEQELFKRWEEGTYGALQLEEYLKLLIKDVDIRIKEFAKKQKDYESKLETMKGELRGAQDNVTGTGLLGNLLGKRQDRFQEYCEANKQYYIERTRLESYKYAVTLLENIKIALQDLETYVLAFSTLLSAMTEKAQYQASQRCGEETSNDAKTLRKYDKNAVNDIKDKAIRNEDTQAQIARTVRAALVAKTGDADEKGFGNFLKAFGGNEGNLDASADYALNTVFEVCIQSAEKEVEERSKEDPRLKVTNVNILEKLRQEYDDPSGEKLHRFTHELMESARTFIKKNDSEVTRLSNGNQDKTMTAYIVYLPEETDESGFRDRLFRAFQDTIGANKVSLAQSHRGDQIAIMTLCSMFPLRHVDNLTVLKEAYDRLVKGRNADIHSLVLHTETFKDPLPSLYETSLAEMALELPKPMMLGFAMGIIRESTDSRTGKKAFYFFTVDKYGDAERSEMPWGKDFPGVIKYLTTNRKEALILQDEVKKRLKRQYVHIDDKADLMKEVNKVLRTHVLEACGGDEFSPEYVKYKKIRNSLDENELNTED